MVLGTLPGAFLVDAVTLLVVILALVAAVWIVIRFARQYYGVLAVQWLELERARVRAESRRMADEQKRQQTLQLQTSLYRKRKAVEAARKSSEDEPEEGQQEEPALAASGAQQA